MSTRRRAREIVLQLLYEADMDNLRDEAAAKKFIKSRLQGRKGLTDFAYRMLTGTLNHQLEIDQQLTRLAQRWALSRMAVADRNVLRLGAFEILFGETPGRVAVNEAVVLSKRYGSKDSPRFVNGILDRLLKDHESPDPLPTSATAAEASLENDSATGSDLDAIAGPNESENVAETQSDSARTSGPLANRPLGDATTQELPSSD